MNLHPPVSVSHGLGLQAYAPTPGFQMFLHKNLSGAELPVGLWHMVDKLLMGQTEASGSEVSQSPAQRGELEVLCSRVCKGPSDLRCKWTWSWL